MINDIMNVFGQGLKTLSCNFNDMSAEALCVQ